MTTEAFAPAKINLTLHVTGQRDDGYHLLDSLVVFADMGDRVRVAAADALSLRLTGPQAGAVPAGGDNLVLRAARLLDARRGAAITLHKELPVASGIGGGSSDAAACLRALSALWGVPLPPDGQTMMLGADLPVCLAARGVRMAGVGETLAPVDVPPLHLVLVNPGVALSTPQVFAALAAKTNRPMPDVLPQWRDTRDLANWLGAQRNDLELPARALAPAIGVVLNRISATPDCLLARMSGSGATCFGLYDNRAAADLAAQAISERHPDWWVRAASEWRRPS
jgi:4-diphosphocytidyl-2-C-methyl-D-erythritol kinase